MRETYRELERLSAIHPEASIQFVPGVEFFDVADPAYFDPKLTQENGYASWPGFRVLESREYPQGHESIKLGVTYTAWVLNSPMYLRWLERQAEKLGVQFICRDLVALEEAVFVYREQEYHKDRGILAVVNASGRGFDDPQSYPSRGQFIAVANRCDKTVSHHWSDGSTTVIIPRPLGGGTIIGGTKEPNNWYVHRLLLLSSADGSGRMSSPIMQQLLSFRELQHCARNYSGAKRIAPAQRWDSMFARCILLDVRCDIVDCD